MDLGDGSLDPVYLKILDEISFVSATGSLSELMQFVVEAYGLKHAAYLAFNLPGRSHREPYFNVTYSSNWTSRYIDQDYFRLDPVITRGFTSILPLDWTEFDLSPRRIKAMFGEAREFGVGRNGLTCPIRGRHGEHALFTITSDDPNVEWARKRKLLMRDFQIIAYHIHAMVLRIERILLPEVKLAPREIDCIKWAALGKTSAETADILGIGERTVRFYLELARHKLDAVNITNAVARAIALNIISVGV